MGCPTVDHLRPKWWGEPPGGILSPGTGPSAAASLQEEEEGAPRGGVLAPAGHRPKPS